MTAYKRGDVVLVPFVFSDDSGVKQRPAVVISSDTYNRARQEVIISAITSRTDRILNCDHLIKNWKEAGLVYPSVATGIIRTIKQSLIIRRLGSMSKGDLEQIDKQLRIAIGMDA